MVGASSFEGASSLEGPQSWEEGALPWWAGQRGWEVEQLVLAWD